MFDSLENEKESRTSDLTEVGGILTPPDEAAV